MSVIYIEGGRPLQGTVPIAGSKNTALAILSAVLLSKGKTTISNVPNVSDLRIKQQLLDVFGAQTVWDGDELIVDCSDLHDVRPDADLVRSIRTSFYLLGPLLARNKRVTMPAPGGCKIGARPVDYHLKGLEAMGAQIDLVEGTYVASADRLVGAKIHFGFPSAGATQHLMTTACIAHGITTITNAAIEPEVTHLADFLGRLGARIEGVGTHTICIYGKDSLGGSQYRIPADRMQAGTYLMAGAVTGGDVTVQGVLPEELASVTSKLTEMGAEITEGHDTIRVQAPNRLKAVRIKTMPHPGFPTDLQQPAAAILATAEGTSVIEETIYESRIGHIDQLNRMGADITLEAGKISIITGVDRLSGTSVEASDLRAGAALVVAGLAAEGETQVRNVQFIDRGYANLEANLNSLGARVHRESDETQSHQEVLV